MKVSKFKIKDVADVFIGVNLRNSVDGFHIYNLIKPSDLNEFNELNPIEKIKLTKEVSEKLLVKSKDILVKRVHPAFVTLVEKRMKKTIVSSNLIILRSKGIIYPKYLGGILEFLNAKTMSHYSQRGETIRSLSKREIEDFRIPVPDYNIQKNLGEIWFLNKKKKKLLKNKFDIQDDFINSLYYKMI